MASEALNKYIEKRYDRWLDYAKYHCSLAGMSSEAIDVLNEVMCMLLQKPLEHLSRLMEAKQGKYTELDWYILQMIKLNVTSDMTFLSYLGVIAQRQFFDKAMYVCYFCAVRYLSALDASFR